MSSKEFSTLAVNPKSRILEKLATKKSFTIFPISVGTNLFLLEPVFSVKVCVFTSPF